MLAVRQSVTHARVSPFSASASTSLYSFNFNDEVECKCIYRLFLNDTSYSFRVVVAINSPEIARASLHSSLPWWAHVYAVPFLSLYPLLAYAYFVRYDDWLKSEEWTFLACVGLGAGHALSFLATRWSTSVRAFITCRNAGSLLSADCVRVAPAEHRGKGGIVPLRKKNVSGQGCVALEVYSSDSLHVAGRPVHVHIFLPTRHVCSVIGKPYHFRPTPIPGQFTTSSLELSVAQRSRIQRPFFLRRPEPAQPLQQE